MSVWGVGGWLSVWEGGWLCVCGGGGHPVAEGGGSVLIPDDSH